MGFKTINGKKVFIDDDKPRSRSNGNNDESEGMKIGSGTRVPDFDDDKDIELDSNEQRELEEKIREMGREFPEPEELKDAGVKSSDSAKTALKKLIDEGVIEERDHIEVENIDLRELRDHPSFEEDNEWLDVFANTPEVVVYDENKDIFFIWFGGDTRSCAWLCG